MRGGVLHLTHVVVSAHPQLDSTNGACCCSMMKESSTRTCAKEQCTKPSCPARTQQPAPGSALSEADAPHTHRPTPATPTHSPRHPSPRPPRGPSPPPPAGASRPRQAWLNTQVSVLMGTVTMIVCAGILLLYRNHLGGLFSADREVVLLTSQAVPTLAISLIGAAGRVCVCVGCREKGCGRVVAVLLRACGRRRRRGPCMYALGGRRGGGRGEGGRGGAPALASPQGSGMCGLLPVVALLATCPRSTIIKRCPSSP